MRNILILSVALVIFSCKQKTTSSTASQPQQEEEQAAYAIVIHGGAGTILKENMSDSLENAYKQKLEEAINTGYTILKNGGSSLEAVQRTINIMEDSPLFNSAKGAVFTHEGKNELDASIMDGKTLNAGAVAGVTTVKNPINLAYEVMANSDHVMLSGEGAEEFAKMRELEIVDPSYFYTENRYQALQRSLEREKQVENPKTTSIFYDPYILNEKYGTVGCVALDKEGNIVAGTSTGGMNNKRWNRIGDSPIIGSGTYANNATCGVSSTGWGEYFIRGQVAYDISAQIEYAGKSLKEATHNVIQEKLTKMGGTGGIIALDNKGNVSMEFNTPGMYRAFMSDTKDLTIGIYKE